MAGDGCEPRAKRQVNKVKASLKAPLKGQIGTADKVLEEAHELVVAVQVQDPVNQLMEVRDVLGACAAFLTEHFPKTDLLALCRGALAMNAERAKGAK